MFDYKLERCSLVRQSRQKRSQQINTRQKNIGREQVTMSLEAGVASEGREVEVPEVVVVALTVQMLME